MRADRPRHVVATAGSSFARLATPAQVELALLGAMIPVEATVVANASRPLGAILLTLTAGAAATIIWDAARAARDHGSAAAQTRSSATPAPASAPRKLTSPAERIADAIGHVHTLAGRAALAVVAIRPGDYPSPQQVEFARHHVEAIVRRVSRNSDILIALDERRIALVLGGCDGADAAVFGQRLTIAVHNRPAPGFGPIGLQVTTLEYDPARFQTPHRFLAAFGLAATGAAGRAETPSRPLDGHDIRRRILGEGFSNYRPGGFGGLVRARVARPLRVVA
ncbi:MAG: hypothetical protein Kow0010_18780 [Dehalococcoidia bacterium]